MTQAEAQTVTTDTQPTAAEVLDGKPAAQAQEAAPAKQDERISSKLSVLTRRERAAVERERAATAKEQDILAREKRLQEDEALWASNPFEALKKRGTSYQKLTEMAMNDGQITPEHQIQDLQSKFDSFLKGQEDEKRSQAEEQRREAEKKEQEMTFQYKGKIGSYLKENANRYELTSFHYGEEDAQDIVYDVIDEHYLRTAPKDAEGNLTGPGKVMTIAEAADKVELHLEQKYAKARDLNKVKGLLAVRQEAPAKTDTKPQTQSRQPQKTLTNNLSASSSQVGGRVLSDEERVAKAIAYARGLRS